MKNQLTLYIGTVRKGDFESLIRRNIPRGILIDKNSAARLPDLKDFQVVEYCDFHALETDVFKTIKHIQREWDIVCALTTHENYVLPCSAITEKLGLYGLSQDSAHFCLDKTFMHERFVQRIGPDSTARFMKIDSRQDLLDSYTNW